MWTAEPVPAGASRGVRAGSRREAGFTFIEIAVTLVILGIISLAAQQTLTAVSDATNTMEAMRKVEQRTEEIVGRIHRDVSSSRKLFFRGTEGNAYLQALDLSRFPPADGVRLPLPDEANPLGRDTPGMPRTANVLLFAREADPYVCSANSSTGGIRYIDVYRFVCVYPHEVDGKRVLTREEPYARDLVVWVSAGFPSHAQLLAVSDATERANIVRALRNTYGFPYAWDPDAEVGSAFYALGTTGSISTTPDSDPSIPEDLTASPGGQLLHVNFQLARTDANSVVRQAVLTKDDPDTWVPDGFEVKVVGKSSSRKVWMRLTVEGQSLGGHDVVHGSTLIAACRDL